MGGMELAGGLDLGGMEFAGGLDLGGMEEGGGAGLDSVAGGFPSVSVTGQTVVETAIVFVTTAVVLDSAGQSVTLAAHEVIVETVVV